MTAYFNVIEESSVSRAWAKAMLKLLDPGVEEISPLLVSINLPNGDATEMPEIKSLADAMLGKFDLPSCETTANTIFPNSLWIPENNSQELYDRYTRILPKLKKYSGNRYGTYFERLTSYGGATNQLKHILTTWEGGNHRRSALQAAIFDPTLDHTHQRQRGFPCLQNVTFSPGAEGLTICGTYAIQSIFDRAYGNYLGLYRLGRFMAHEMKVPLRRLHCVTNFANLGTPSKSELNTMKNSLCELVRKSRPTSIDGSGSLVLEQDGFTLLDEDVRKDDYAAAR